MIASKRNSLGQRFPSDKHGAVLGPRVHFRRPTVYAGLVAWYDASVASDLTVDGSNLVSNWRDRTGLGGRDLVQATSTNQPVYNPSTKTVTFDGVDNFMKTAAFTLNQPCTVYFVGSQLTWVADRYFFDGFAVNSGAMAGQTSTPGIVIYAGGAVGATNYDWAVGERAALGLVFNGASSSIKVNDNAAQTVAVGSNNMGGFTLANAGSGASYGHCTVNEVCIYNTAHTAAQQAQFWQYAKRKWGIAG